VKLVRHKRTDTVYVVRKELQMKHPTTRDWVDAVEYSDYYRSTCIYVREKSDFDEKFEVIEFKEDCKHCVGTGSVVKRKNYMGVFV